MKVSLFNENFKTKYNQTTKIKIKRALQPKLIDGITLIRTSKW